ncbi:hypothetical protein GR925_06040 [Streptomyces sp. HUCO-GS316]|uniref:hypothetical protein n=1 Tax=Streptomyces sp. HUCO-GS316 TaxID=2692198 RepID=UPI00136B721F|nr:hypothetical protein [Streptomyces sp. HUCO-GS316]
MSTAPGGPRALSLETLVRLRRGRPSGSRTPDTPRRLSVPEGMMAPLGCDAVGTPTRLGPLLMPRMPRVGCVYADEAHWWWIVPSDSDHALRWPAPTRYATGALVAGSPGVPGLIHQPAGILPYTPPIPLYLAVCRLTGTAPAWSRPVIA